MQHGANDVGNAWEVRNFEDVDEANDNQGFAARKALLGTSSTVNCEIPLNRYSFFEALEDKLLPDTYLNAEVVERSGALRQQTENFRITNAISKPRRVFLLIINTQILSHKQHFILT